MSVIKNLADVGQILILLVGIGVMTWAGIDKNSPFRLPSDFRRSWSKRSQKSIFKIIFIGTGFIITQWFIPQLRLNTKMTVLGLSFFEVYRFGIFLWVYLEATPLFGEAIFNLGDRICTISAFIISKLIGILRRSRQEATEEES